MKPITTPAALPVIALLALLLGSAASAVETVDLSAPPEHLPYRLQLSVVHPNDGWTNPNLVTAFNFLDLDGDGFEEEIAAHNPGINASRRGIDYASNLWQHNLPPSHAWREPCASIDGLWDVDGDGSREVVATGSRSDGSDWRIWAFAATDGRLVDEVRLPVGVDNRRDGRWDGHYRVLGMIDVPSGEGAVRAYAVCVDAAFDCEPRGVMAIVPGRGEDAVLWEFRIGAKPDFPNSLLTDIEGDGAAEIILATAAVNNLGGREIGGYGDDRAWVFVIDCDGSVRWRRSLFAGTGTGSVAAADLDGDGVREVIAATNTEPENGNELMVLSGRDGSVLAAAGLPVGARVLCAVPPRGGRPAAVISGLSAYRGILRFDFVDGSLELAARAEITTGCTLQICSDLVPEPGREVVITDSVSGVHLLDEMLRPLAAYRFDQPTRRPGFNLSGKVWRPDPETTLVFLPGDEILSGSSFTIVPNPRTPIVNNWWLLALVPAFGVIVAGVRRRTRARIRADLARDNRLRLLEKLQLADHGRIGPLKSLRRLLMLVRAGSRHGARLDLGRVRGAQADFTGKSLPDLRLTLEIAATAGVADHLLIAAHGALERLGEILAREIDAAGIADLGEELAAVAEEAERSLQNLRAAAEAGFQTDLAAALKRVLAAHAERIAELGVRTERPGGDKANAVCRIDESELVFVLDNLVENALEAMADSDARRLAVDWSVDRDRVAVTVADTGCGVDPDAAERIFAPGYSGRGSSGIGLAKSRELLARYRGAIRLVESSPGRGSVFAIEIPGRGA